MAKLERERERERGGGGGRGGGGLKKLLVKTQIPCFAKKKKKMYSK